MCGDGRYVALRNERPVAQPGAEGQIGRAARPARIVIDAMRGREDQIGRDQRAGAIACVTELDLAYGLPAEKIVTVGQSDQAAARAKVVWGVGFLTRRSFDRC